MFKAGNAQPQERRNSWQNLLDQFVQTHQQQLAALAWGKFIEQQGREDAYDTLGIDLKPTPHFVSCPRSSLEALNRNVNYLLQEIIGIVEGHKPEQEVVIIAIGEDQIKLINFAPETPPPECFAQIDQEIELLMRQLEESLTQHLQSVDT